MSSPLSEKERQQRLALVRIKQHAMIDKHGYTVQQVFGDEQNPPFFYTIGAASQGFPDILISGALPPQIAAHLIHDTLEYWRKHGVKLGIRTEGDEDYGFNLSVNVVALEVTPELTDEYVIQADGFYEEHPKYLKREAHVPEYVQVLLSDPQGKLPHEEGFRSDQMPQVVMKPKVMY